MSVIHQVLGCRKCELRNGCTAPVPMSHNPEDAVAVIGEAPGEDEDLEGVPFVGRSGQFLRNSLRVAGLKPSVLSYMNVVCCRPHDSGTNRPPTQKEVTACQGNFTDQLAAIDPEYVLVVGATSLAVTLPSGVGGQPLTARIGDTHGHWWKMTLPGTPGNSAWAMATWHPAYVLRQYEHKSKWQEELREFAEVVQMGVAPWANDYCIRCADEAVYWAGETLGFCRKCAEAVGCDVEPDVSNKWVLTIHTTRVLVEAPDAETAKLRFAASRGYAPELLAVQQATVAELREFRRKRGRPPESLPLFDDLSPAGNPTGADHRR